MLVENCFGAQATVAYQEWLCCVGDTFSDITESVGLDAEAQTLTAATISPGCMAQVFPLYQLVCVLLRRTYHPCWALLPHCM